jgi:endonuclease YncB( thermonuclease family)
MADAKRPTKALETNGVIKKGHFKLGMWGARRGTPAQMVHDGDTVGLNTALDFSSRFLGIDAPEISFTIRTKDTFVGVGDAKWVTFWTSGEWKNLPITATLMHHLEGRVGDGTKVAANHEKLAKQAEKTLTELIAADIAAAGKTTDDFEFFLAFGYEFLDQYGRMLCYLNADRTQFAAPAVANELSYNERLLATGAVVPYFIFPNLQPFMSGQPFDAASIVPAGFWKSIHAAGKLTAARAAVAAARQAGKGVFAPNGEGLMVLPYELRFIARLGSKGPDRFVIDLGKPGGNKILKPEKYFSIAKVEDRLFVAKEFVPLFALNGWQIH